MTPAHQEPLATIYHGDCVEIMAAMPEASVDAIVTDPPYGLEFMGKEWDSFRVDDPGTKRWRGDRASGSPGELTGPDEKDRHGKVGHGGQRPRTSRCRACGKRDMMRNPHACGDKASWAEEVTDPYAAPPAMLAFGEWSRRWALEAYRVLKPGGHLLAFGGSRTYHRLACAIEDAGFEVRDSLMWLYAQGFPKSLDVSKAIDKAAGAERPVVGARQRVDGKAPGIVSRGKHGRLGDFGDLPTTVTGPATDDAARWSGFGTALKPAHESIILARKPLAAKNVAANVLAHGTGALNVDGCRIEGPAWSRHTEQRQDNRGGKFHSGAGDQRIQIPPQAMPTLGRWPANVLLGHHALCGRARLVCLESPFAGDVETNVAYARRALADSLRRGEYPIASHLLYTQPGVLDDTKPDERALGIKAGLTWAEAADTSVLYMDRGVSRGMRDGIARAEAAGRRVVRRWLDESGKDEEIGCHSDCAARLLDEQSGETGSSGRRGGSPESTGIYGDGFPRGNGVETGKGDFGGASRFFYTSKAGSEDRDGSKHPTVKPVDLMKWLVRLVTPPDGVVLDPFLGSGTTVYAARALGIRSIGIEKEPQSVEDAIRRLRQGVLL